MKIERAIEILEKRAESPFVRANPDSLDALKLGIEALTRVKGDQESSDNPFYLPLIGETK